MICLTNWLIKNKKGLRYFNISEFDSPDIPGSGEFMDKKFLVMLDKARDIAGIPFEINSGYRTDYQNNKVGGKENSSHLVGRAADIHCNSSRDRFTIITALIAVGFERLGVAKTFIHVDNDINKDKRVAWIY